jgi:cobalt/nickel transport protein
MTRIKSVAFLILLFALTPLVSAQEEAEPWSGADGLAEDKISEIAPDYEPWFDPIWEPPSGEIESLLFSLQAALGALVIGYYLGYHKGKSA